MSHIRVTTSELHSKMIELAGREEVCSIKLIKKKLEMRYSGEIIISNVPGKSNLVCFKDASRFLIEKSLKHKEIPRK